LFSNKAREAAKKEENNCPVSNQMEKTLSAFLPRMAHFAAAHGRGAGHKAHRLISGVRRLRICGVSSKSYAGAPLRRFGASASMIAPPSERRGFACREGFALAQRVVCALAVALRREPY